MATASFGGNPGLLVATLPQLELQDWRAFQQAASWARAGIAEVELALRDEVLHLREDVKSPFQMCRRADVTGLWAYLFEDGTGLCHPDGQVRKRGDSGDSLLHEALQAQNADCSRLLPWLLRQQGAAEAAAAPNFRGETALHVCAAHGLWLVTRRLLRLPGPDINALDRYGRPPLMTAVDAERPGMVGVLLAARANPNVFVPGCHGHGDTALVHATRLRNATIVRQLVNTEGIDLHQSTLLGVPFGKTAIDFAPRQGTVRQLLEEAIAKEKATRAAAHPGESSVLELWEEPEHKPAEKDLLLEGTKMVTCGSFQLLLREVLWCLGAPVRVYGAEKK